MASKRFVSETVLSLKVSGPGVQVFRFNNRKDMNDSDRFDLAVRQIIGKRLTWAEVTGKVSETSSLN
jgi:hypothetical protein